MDNDYVQTKYFRHRAGHTPVEHCMGNSCANLVALNTETQDQRSIIGQVGLLFVVPDVYWGVGVAFHGADTRPGPLLHPLQIPLVRQPDVGHVPKPARSDPDEAEALAAHLAAGSLDRPAAPVYVHSADGEEFRATEYYEELRRRSLEGRAPLRFGEHPSHPLEDAFGAEQFDVALY